MIDKYLNEDLPFLEFHLGLLGFFLSFPVYTETASNVWKLEILFSGK